MCGRVVRTNRTWGMTARSRFMPPGVRRISLGKYTSSHSPARIASALKSWRVRTAYHPGRDASSALLTVSLTIAVADGAVEATELVPDAVIAAIEEGSASVVSV